MLIRRASLITLVLVLLVVAAPLFIRSKLHSAIEDLHRISLAGQLLNQGQVRVLDSNWFKTELHIASRARDWSVSGPLTLSHSPLVCLGGSNGWPGYLAGVGYLDIAGSVLRTEGREAPAMARVAATAGLGGLGQLNLTLQAPAGELVHTHINMPITGASLSVDLDLLDEAAPSPFSASLLTTFGHAQALGQFNHANGRLSVTVRVAATLAEALAASAFEAELRNTGSQPAEDAIVQSVAKRRINSLVQLGFLQADGPEFVIEAGLDQSGLSVFGEPVNTTFTVLNDRPAG